MAWAGMATWTTISRPVLAVGDRWVTCPTTISSPTMTCACCPRWIRLASVGESVACHSKCPSLMMLNSGVPLTAMPTCAFLALIIPATGAVIWVLFRLFLALLRRAKLAFFVAWACFRAVRWLSTCWRLIASMASSGSTRAKSACACSWLAVACS